MPGASARRLIVPILAVLACGGADGLEPEYRFVEPDLHAARDALPPVATIDDETRTTLYGHRVRTLVSVRSVPVKDGIVTLRPRLRGVFRGAKRLLVQPLVYREHRWHVLTTTLVPVQRDSRGDEFVVVEFWPTGARRKKGRVDVAVKAFVAPDAPDPDFETPPVQIAAGSVLEFSTGLLATGPAQSAVGFSIDICHSGECQTRFAQTLDPTDPDASGWHDHALPLAEYAGRTVSFVFRTRHLDAAPQAMAFPVWGNPAVYRPAKRSASAPSFILISLDTLRADHLSFYGYRRLTSPRLDVRIPPNATVFEQCVAPASTTGPSHMTMFTSLQPLVHGVRKSAGSRKIPPSVRTLAQLLRSGRFFTGAVTENGPLGIHKGFGRGFDTFRENKAPKTQGAFEGRIARTLGEGRTWLTRHGSKRFFLFLHTYETHTPYRAPAIFDPVFADDPDRAPFDHLPEGEQPIDYDREIRYADQEVAEFLSWLDAEGHAENTIVILTSDHGEAFMEHGFRFHGSDLHEEILRVPLTFQGPGIAANRRVDVPVGLIDMLPTVLELAGLPPSRQAHGRSLAPLLRGEPTDPETWMSRTIYSEAWQTHAATLKWFQVLQPTFAVRLGHRKLIRYREPDGFRYVYYDLAQDPREERDLYPQMPGLAVDLRQLIDRYEAISEELRAALQSGGAADEDEIDPEREEKLRALGYID
ncbi:MAG: sulfatase [Deltaproteobacteria bacterium]|nr:sulfatase [Deltaproteobacteria bacterium]MBW2414006.1 sulfatase [Deltaproteobacteria bacterium]